MEQKKRHQESQSYLAYPVVHEIQAPDVRQSPLLQSCMLVHVAVVVKAKEHKHLPTHGEEDAASKRMMLFPRRPS
ncbi:MAG: hypothetical protein AB1733_04260 [Thermodesulfobacteriota bacterium]